MKHLITISLAALTGSLSAIIVDVIADVISDEITPNDSQAIIKKLDNIEKKLDDLNNMINNYWLKKFAAGSKKLTPQQQKHLDLALQRQKDITDALDSVYNKNLSPSFKSEDAKRQIYRTALMESGIDQNAVTQKGGGPALGATQIEPKTYIDLFRYLNQNAKGNTPKAQGYRQLLNDIKSKYGGKYTKGQLKQFQAEQDSLIGKMKPKEQAALKDFRSGSKANPVYVPYQRLKEDPKLGYIMSRVKYMMNKNSIPSASKPVGQFNYWKDIYNTNPNLDRNKLLNDFKTKRDYLRSLGDQWAFNQNNLTNINNAVV